MIGEYFRHVQQGLDQILLQEIDSLRLAASKVAETIRRDGIIHLFGCGHSHMMAEELFYRAGGLACIHPVFVEPLMLHEGATRASQLEREDGLGEQIVRDLDICKRDLFIVISTSGRNSVPIDVALSAKKKGCFVLGLTSFDYRNLESRHKSGLHLADAVDLAIHNHVPRGDAALTHKDVITPFSPVSSIYNIAILHSIFAQAIVELAEERENPPIFVSGNVDGADQHNRQLVNMYQERIPLLNVEKKTV